MEMRYSSRKRRRGLSQSNDLADSGEDGEQHYAERRELSVRDEGGEGSVYMKRAQLVSKIVIR